MLHSPRFIDASINWNFSTSFVSNRDRPETGRLYSPAVSAGNVVAGLGAWPNVGAVRDGGLIGGAAPPQPSPKMGRGSEDFDFNPLDERPRSSANEQADRGDGDH